ncbi:MAG TPA: ATP-binding cassette domain-containing protein [Polyangiaceae bacterium]
MTEPLISVRDLSVGWNQRVLLSGASFDVAHGDVFVILGGSGCGKSTLLRYLIGLETPLAGTITIAGIGAPRLEGNAPEYGVMFQSGALFSSMTVAENVGFALHEWTRLPNEAVNAIVKAKLALVGLEGAGEKLPSELSGGMRKRAAIARAMAFEPNLIFLDEPSAGLDPVSAAELDELIIALNRGIGLTVVMVTHELESIFKVGKSCIMLDKETKSILAAGDPRELRARSDEPKVRQFFQREAGAR